MITSLTLLVFFAALGLFGARAIRNAR